jgi:hypothetical protein
VSTSQRQALRLLLDTRQEVRQFQSHMAEFQGYRITGNNLAGLEFVPAAYLNTALATFCTDRLIYVSSALEALSITEDD